MDETGGGGAHPRPTPTPANKRTPYGFVHYGYGPPLKGGVDPVITSRVRANYGGHYGSTTVFTTGSGRSEGRSDGIVRQAPQQPDEQAAAHPRPASLTRGRHPVARPRTRGSCPLPPWRGVAEVGRHWLYTSSAYRYFPSSTPVTTHDPPTD